MQNRVRNMLIFYKKILFFRTQFCVCYFTYILVISPTKSIPVNIQEGILIEDSESESTILSDLSGFQSTNELTVSSVDVSWLSSEIKRLQEEQSTKRNLKTLLDRYVQDQEPISLNISHLHPGKILFLFLLTY